VLVAWASEKCGRKEAIMTTVQTTDALFHKSPELGFHSQRVQLLAKQFGEWMDLSISALEKIEIGGLLHDYGKLNIPLSILDKKGPLTSRERTIIENHPKWGIDLLYEIQWELDNDISAMVLQHHEFINGNGYPLGLKENEIHPLAKIIAVCDVYDALTSPRSYKPPMGIEWTIEYIKHQQNIQFDVRVTNAFIAFLTENDDDVVVNW
jgi:HD-GYP domain-containing protein (c-di-GMP phosphodiesterase class II)